MVIELRIVPVTEQHQIRVAPCKSGLRPKKLDAGFHMAVRLSFLGVVAALALCALPACQLVPQKPEAVFVVYRDRMKSGRIDKARELLTDASRELALDLAAQYGLKEQPESLALLSILDPVSPPLVMKEGESYALLQLRTLKGSLRLVRLVRDDTKGHWKIDISEELKSLQTFLRGRKMLDMIREQAGEFAASWKAFQDHLGRMSVQGAPGEEGESAAPRGR